MLKTLSAIAGGIFVGAVAVEILRTKCPDTLDKFYAKVNNFAAGIKEGFHEGYCSVSKVTTSSEPAEVRA
jgi:hypothetical protein